MLKDKRVKKNEEDLTNQVMAIFFISGMLLFGLTYLVRAWEYYATHNAAFFVISWLRPMMLAGMAAGAAWAIWAVKRGKYRPGTVINGVWLFFLCGVIWVICHCIYYDRTLWVRAWYALIPAFALLFLIYAVYSRTFFMMALTHTILGATFWILYKSTMNSQLNPYRTAAIVLGLAVCVAAAVLYLMARKNGGQVKLGRLSLSLISPHTHGMALLVLYSVSALALLAAFVLGGKTAWVLLLADLVFLGVSAIYYTIRLI